MVRPGELNHRSNDELARLLYQRDNRPTPPPVALDEAPPPRRSLVDAGVPAWTLGESQAWLHPVTDRERRALFAALSRGTKAKQGREPTVNELMVLVEKVNKARALATAARDAILGTACIHIEDGKLLFHESGDAGGANDTA